VDAKQDAECKTSDANTTEAAFAGKSRVHLQKSALTAAHDLFSIPP
jgi:hypothetical protein